MSVESHARWGPGLPGAWTPYLVTARNTGSVDFTGFVLLKPVPGPGDTLVQGPGQVPAVVALGGRRSGPGQDPPFEELFTGAVSPAPPIWPTYRSPVTLAAGGEKVLELFVVESRFGHTANLVDTEDRLISAEVKPVQGQTRNAWAVAVLSRRAHDASARAGPGQLFGSPRKISATLLESARDFPDDALELTGLQAVILDDFDSESLTSMQIKALQDFVGLGGGLILGGGVSWSATLQSLPPELVPIEPGGHVDASLAALAHVAGRPTSARATVVIGELRHGESAVHEPGPVPLIVESDYGSGKVVQLAYDPFAEPFLSDESVSDLGLEAGLSRVLDRLVLRAERTDTIGTANALWWPAMVPEASVRDRPAWPRWSAGVATYAVLLGPASFLLLRRGRRRRRPDRRWLAIPVAVVLVAGVAGLSARSTPAGAPIRNLVELRTLSPNGTAVLNSYTALFDSSDVRPALAVPPGAAGSTVVAVPSIRSVTATSQEDPAAAAAFLQPVPEGGPFPGTAEDGPFLSGREGLASFDGAGGVTLISGRAEKRQARAVQTLSLDHRHGGLEAELRLTGTANANDLRLAGKVTNHTGQPVFSLQAFLPDRPGRRYARLAEVLDPRATVHIDVPVMPFIPGGPSVDTRPAWVLAGGAAFSGATDGQVSLVGFDNRNATVEQEGSTLTALVVQAVPVDDKRSQP